MCIYLWVCATCVQVPVETGREDINSFRTGVVGSYELPHWAVETKLKSRGQQALLTAEPVLSPSPPT